MKPTALTLLSFLLLGACTNNIERQIDYCERYKADQSNLSRSHMSKTEKKERFAKRQAIFKENWEIFSDLIQSDNLSVIGKDTCYTDFLLVTLVHNVQNFPREIFNKEMIDSIQKEIDKGNIDSEHIKLTLSMYKNYTLDDKRCIDMKEMVDYAIATWQTNENYDDIQYIDCTQKDN